jgi:integrase
MNGPSPHRTWSKERFLGRTDYEVFLVIGKGGLKREVAISQELAEELRKRKRLQPVVIRDREINHVSYFDIGGGQALSASFSRASKLSLGWSRGLHGLRHSFAQNRLRTLIELLGPQRALQILSEELGHFRSEISLAYLVGR